MKEIIFGLLLVLGVFLVGCDTVNLSTDTQRPSTENVGREIGQQAVDISFITFNGEQLSLSDFRGTSAIVVNAWAAWCPFCINEMPEMQQVSNELGDDVIVIFVHRTKTESVSKAQQYLDDFPGTRDIEITDPVVQDPEENFYRTYFGFGMPVTVFIDKEGIVRDRKIGPLTLEEAREKMGALR
jgi:cytochrome c biogenesis protein CcmG, thiol:disulfide interchange protein DsbE